MRAICVDIDNVLARTDEVMRKVIRDHSTNKVDLTYDDVVCFEYSNCRDAHGRKLGEDEWHDIHRIFTMGYLDEIQPHKGAIEGLREIANRFEIHVATSRMKEGLNATSAWLKRHGFPRAELHHVEHGEKHLINIPFAAAIDDDREQAYLFRHRGIPAYLLAHPWNHVSPLSPLVRVESWKELTRLIVSLPKVE